MINMAGKGHSDLYQKLEHTQGQETDKERLALQTEYLSMETGRVKAVVGIAD